MRYYANMAPPDACGPFEVGTFAASVAGRPDTRGYGATEHAAITVLASDLRRIAARENTRPRLTACCQVLTAAKRLSYEDFVNYLEDRSMEPMLV